MIIPNIQNNRFTQKANPRIKRGSDDAGTDIVIKQDQIQPVIRTITDLGLYDNLKLYLNSALFKKVAGAIINTYTTVTYTANGTFTVPAGITNIEYLVVGGGGGGNAYGGGGGGGVQYSNTYSVTPGNSLSITIGSGGNGHATAPSNGGSTSLGTITAGGGRAATGGTYRDGGRSGSPQSNNGGTSPTTGVGAGGGGAGGVGQNNDGNNAGDGGAGYTYNSVTYAQGGGGLSNPGTNGSPLNPSANSGGGGGGGSRNGGSGIVIIKYISGSTGTNDTTSKVYNLSTTNNDAVQATTANQPEINGVGFDFDGTNDSLTISDTGLPSGTSNRTIIGFFKTDSLNNSRILGYGTWSNSNAFEIINWSSAKVAIIGHTVNHFGTITISAGVWYMFAVVKDGTNMKLYINDVLDFSVTTTLNTILNGSFRIGMSIISDNYFNGRVDDIMVFNTALTAAQLLNIFHSTGCKYFWDNYVNRVTTAGDSIIDQDITQNQMKYLFNKQLASNLILHISSEGGIEKRTVGSDDFVVTAYDFSGKKNDATQATTASQPKLVSLGFDWTDANDYSLTTSAKFDGFSELSFSIWANFIASEDSGTNAALIQSIMNMGNLVADNASNTAWCVYLDPRTDFRAVRFILSDGTNQISTNISADNLVNNQWYMISGTWNGATTKQVIYLDGIAVTTSTSAAATMNSDTTLFSIGGDNRAYTHASARRFRGKLNDVMLFDKTLTASEVMGLYSMTKPKYE